MSTAPSPSPSPSALDSKLDSESKLTLPTPNQDPALKEQSRAPSEKSASTTESSSAAFNPGWRFYLAFSSLSVITLMAALDATSISVALPVGVFFPMAPVT